MRYYNGLDMGEGIAGPATIGASTTGFLTCMGITFVNRGKNFGGVYHYPGRTINNANVSGTIRQMVNDIQPDEILLTPGIAEMGQLSAADDIAAVSEFLKAFNATFTLAEAGNSAKLFWRDNQPVFNTPLMGVLEPQSVPHEIRATMSSGRRELEGDTWYYGGNGEYGEVLEQGVKTTKESAKSCCIVM